MTNEELKKKIVEMLFITGQTNDKYCDGKRFIVDEEMADNLADALIAAGLKFDTVVSHTATFDLAQQEYINSLERQVAELEESDASKEQSSINYYCEMREWKDKCKEAEHRAARAERALRIANDLGELCAPVEDYIKQAEKELSEEGK